LGRCTLTVELVIFAPYWSSIVPIITPYRSIIVPILLLMGPYDPHFAPYRSVIIPTLHTLSSVGMALGYGLDDRGSRVRFSTGAGNFSLHHRIQNDSGAHPTSYSMGSRGSFPEDKAAGA
jgi:hypothetical protein